MKLEDIDLLDRDRFSQGFPHEWFELLRREAPVYRHPEPKGPGFWVVSRYHDVVDVGRKANVFSSDLDHGGVAPIEDADDGQAANAKLFGEDGKMLLTMDPPEHTINRKIVNRGFTPRTIAGLEPHVRELCTTVIDDVIERGECDFVTDMAMPLPMQVIGELLGVPREDHANLSDWANRIVGAEDPEYAADTQESVMAAVMEIFSCSDAMAEDRRSCPRDDLVSTLVHAEVDGHSLSRLRLNVFFFLLALAGNETTRNAISHGALALMEHPDQLGRLQENPSLIDSAVEEVLRWASPVMYFRRNALVDSEIGDQQIKAGEKVTLWYTSANYDEDVFDQPLTFDVGRDPNPQIAFGGGGPHFCLGASLARLEIKVMLEELVERMPDMQLAGEPEYLRSNFIRGIKHLPVAFTPGRVLAGATAG